MPNKSIYYAVGRLSMLEKDIIGPGKIERLLQAQSVDEVRKLLLEFGWPDTGDDEKNALLNYKNACDTVKQLSTNDALVHAFLYRYDIANIKILLKSKYAGEKPASLSLCGTIPIDALSKALAEQKYAIFEKSLSAALVDLEKQLSISFQPAQIDIVLDKAYYRYVFNTLPLKYKRSHEYFKKKVDVLSFSMLLRNLKAERPWSTAKSYIINGGYISSANWEKAYQKSERLALLLHKMPIQVYHAAIAAQVHFEKLASFEKISDDSLFSAYLKLKNSMDKDERLIFHLLAKERESAAVRLILAAKENAFSSEEIKERLRSVYV